jgi:Secretion system C-terminal sorting domain
MKKLFTLASVVSVSLIAQGQINPVQLNNNTPFAPKEATQAEMAISVHSSSNNASEQAGDRVVVYSQTFGSGFGDMTHEDSGTTPIWMIATTNSPAGEFSSSLPALASPTAANGWAIFDCDLYNTPISNGVEDVSGSLSTPSINCSALSSVIVEWSQYFRYCCFSASPLTLEVSTDGGTNWTVFPAQGTFVPSANSLSANPLTTKVDISCAAAGQPNVLVRWGYNTAVAAGYSHYFWGIDDISIYDNASTNDLEIIQVTNGDVFNIWEYRVTPFEQRVYAADGGMLVGVIYKNNGSADQTNTVINIDILDVTGAVVGNAVSNLFTMESFGNTPECPSFLNDTLYIQTNWEPAAIGDYTIRASITSLDATDESPTNNTMDKAIVYSTDEYGHDDEGALDVEITPRDSDTSPGEFDPTGYGAFYTVPNPGSMAYGVTAWFGPTTDDLAEFAAILFEGSPNDAVALAAMDYTVDPAWVNSGYEYFPYDAPVDLIPGTAYFGAVMNENTSPLQLTIAADGESDTDNSTAVYEIAGDGTFVWFGSQNWSPAVRLILSERVTVDEINSDNLTFFQLAPNPAVDVTRVNFELKSNSNVAYEVRDINGKLISFSNMGKFSAGKNSFDLNVSSYNAGNYTVSLVVDGSRMFTKVLNVVR